MSLRTPPRDSSAARRARAAVAALFFTNGALFANILPRYPEIKEALGLDNAAYGFTVIAFPAGAIASGLAAGWIIRWSGSARAAVLGTVVTAAGVLAAGLSPTLVLFVVALFLAGAADAITDVAQNAHGLRVQREMGRSILNSFHAVWSIGAVTGGAMAAAAIALRLPLGIHLAVSGALFVTLALVAFRFTLPGRDPENVAVAPLDPDAAPARRGPSARIWMMLAALVLIATAGTTVEDAGFSWAALYLRGDLDAAPALAAAGLIALVGAQFVGRLIGDPLVDRFGQRTVAIAGGLVLAIGMGAALLFPSVPGTIAGFAAAGLGVATLVPAAMAGADALPGLRHGTGLAIVSWLMRLGFLLSPPLVGLVSDGIGLRGALVIMPIMGVLVLLLSGVLPARQGRRQASADDPD
ncbi:MFS transporter [Microbacterium sp. TNHR37B]|uniref:MFS transporter n=1 Tax=Microbacterium sp. TNHR37B TaxID=1775956 RepID=UPI00082C2622|nr:MFS transporter [Microbacterium sp. TNHR37B]